MSPRATPGDYDVHRTMLLLVGGTRWTDAERFGRLVQRTLADPNLAACVIAQLAGYAGQALVAAFRGDEAAARRHVLVEVDLCTELQNLTPEAITGIENYRRSDGVPLGQPADTGDGLEWPEP